ncbi:IclR family transcriptional regulator [Celeribacter sp. ULVN23_4]
MRDFAQAEKKGIDMQDDAPKQGGIQVISRAAELLRCLADHPQGLSLAGMASATGLARSTVQRIIQALEDEGFVESSGRAGGFRLGPTLPELVYRRQIDIVSGVRPYLETLCTDLDETVALYKLSGGRLVALDRCIPERPLRVVFPLGTIPFPPYQLAPGRAMLAQMPRDSAENLLKDQLTTENLTEELTALSNLPQRREGAVFRDTLPFIRDVEGFAVPLQTRLGLHAIAAIVPESRSTGRDAEFRAVLNACRKDIELKFGPGRA